MPAVVSVVGKKGSGKSGVLEKMIVLLKEKGFRIGVIKHLAREDFEIDEPGKDTYRYRMQGASKVILSGRKRLAVFENLSEETSFGDLLGCFEGYDLVFLEGYPPTQKPPDLSGDECVGRILRSRAVKDTAKEDSLLRRIPPTSNVPRDLPAGLHFLEEIPVIEIHKAQAGPLLTRASRQLMAVCSDTKIASAPEDALKIESPIFSFEELDNLARFIEERFLRQTCEVVS